MLEKSTFTTKEDLNEETILANFIRTDAIIGMSECRNEGRNKASDRTNGGKCTNKIRIEQTFPLSNLLADSEESLSLLVIGDQDTPIENNEKITQKVKDILSLPELGMVKNAYPELNIKTEPAYILFDQAGVIHQSKDINELTTYLEQNNPK